MKLSSISTLWDYVRRAMPWDKPKSLTVEEVYAVVAYVLHLGDILPADFVLSDRNMAEVQARLPNRNGMTREHGLWDIKSRPDVANTACMKDCVSEVKLASAIPDHAKNSHGDLAQQNRVVGPGTGQEKVAQAKPAAAGGADLARRNACMSCHGVEKRIVGPGLREVAARYKGQPDAEAKLVEKLRSGGTGPGGRSRCRPTRALPRRTPGPSFGGSSPERYNFRLGQRSTTRSEYMNSSRREILKGSGGATVLALAAQRAFSGRAAPGRRPGTRRPSRRSRSTTP
jgi:cytochrome c